ncbi:3'(2'),5'-bisphosphate nucleotidase CysQ [Teredinibacter purpureus]|jgi:3''(2''),5''-bisphosphate nucleotidase, bacterial|uniref:3'(2'),5'-bisphosphate nucleotidase CysQ n=1 Tax=Teredinibacter purpureus TaxID=2731756 RepID=UPI000695E373|nr:3'(2'),5'-bisphosphate nucleotidase CysQ [Teredinibacter purpureus]
MTAVIDKVLLHNVIELCSTAAQVILEIYRSPENYDIQTKGDDSPVTRADLASNSILMQGLAQLMPGIPILSEEANIPAFDERKQWSRYWLIDPLDGTKEFIHRNGEFTVNVALIDNHVAVMGVVYVPVPNVVYSSIRGLGAWKSSGQQGNIQPIHCETIAALQQSKANFTVVASRRHGTEAVSNLISKIEYALGPIAISSIGSSLKLCMVAEGKAMFYPRLAPTCEWDTAAAQAIVEAAGGAVMTTDLEPLLYNTKANMLNPNFYVIGDMHFNWHALLLAQ